MTRSSLLAVGAAVGVAAVAAIVVVLLLSRGDGDGLGLDLELVEPTTVGITVDYDGTLGPDQGFEIARIGQDGEVVTVAAAASTEPVLDGGLEPETQYSYRVRVVGDGTAEDDWSSWTPITTDAGSSAAGLDEDGEGPIELGAGNTGEEPDLDAPLPSLDDTDLAIRPTMLDFGPLSIGETSELEVAVFNNSDAPFDLGDVTVAGVGYSTDASNCEPEIAGRASCVIIVGFTPQVVGVEEGVLASSSRGALARLSGDGKPSAEDASIRIDVVGSGAGSVTSDPPGITCPSDCSAVFDSGATVTLTAVAETGSLLRGWSGADCGTGSTCTVTASGARDVLAVFDLAPPSTSLTVDIAGSGTGSVTSSPAGLDCPGTCTAPFDAGTEVTLTATAADGSTFTEWGGGGCQAGGSCTVTVTGSQSILAVFEQGGGSGRLRIDIVGLGSGAITSAPGGVTCADTTCSGNFAPGTEVTLTPVPDAGSVFVGWSGGGCPQDTEPCVVTMAEVTNVLAEFSTG